MLECARELRISRETFRLWVHEHGSPGRSGAGRYNIHHWKRWMEGNKGRLASRKLPSILPGPRLSPKQAIELQIAQEALKRRQRENAEAENKMMATEDVDGLIFEVLANLDFHLSNMEREIVVRAASAFRLPAVEVRAISKQLFDQFRRAFSESHLPPSAKKEINAWLTLPYGLKDKILAGEIPSTGVAA